jgi:uncharacterized membrane protein YdjX (TVP38/TMEM64 family)
MINLFAGVTRIKPRTFIWTTSLGIIPGSLVYAYAGFAINDIGEGGIPKNIIFALLLLAGLSAVPLVIKKIRARRGKAPIESEESGNTTRATAAQ